MADEQVGHVGHDRRDGLLDEEDVVEGARSKVEAHDAANEVAGVDMRVVHRQRLHRTETDAAELCEAALHLIKHRNATFDKLLEIVPGPDFPTGGIIVSPRADIAEAYRTGRGGMRVRARWEREEGGRGSWSAVITEIPYQVQKSRLIEAIAGLIEARKLPLVGDVRDESAEDIRVVIEPKSRAIDADLMMESLFKLTDLESRFSLNMNVLSRGQVPVVMSVRDVLLEWLDHRKVVLVRRSNHRLEKIAQRLEVLGGYLIAYLNLDEVIRIIREADEPKTELMARFKLTELQADSILDLRLRRLHKLQEIEIRQEHADQIKERDRLQALLADQAGRWDVIAAEIRAIRDRFGKNPALGARRTVLGDWYEAGSVLACDKHGWTLETLALPSRQAQSGSHHRT